MNSLWKWISGGFLVLLGLGFLAQQFLGLNFWNIFNYFWPLVFILVGAYIIAKSRGQLLIGLIILILGGVMLTGQFIHLPFTVWQLWPLILVAVGINMIFGNSSKWNFTPTNSVTHEDRFDSTAIFWGDGRRVMSDNLKKGEVNAIFGGCEIDLRDAKFAKEGAEIEVNAIFGGVNLIVNKDTLVKSEGVGIFGGFVDKSIKPDKALGVVKVKGAAVFGGVGIETK